VDFVTPTVTPGQTATFSFNVNNSYNYKPINKTWPKEIMTNVTVTAGIYRYATEDEVKNVTDSFPHPPLINGDLEIVQVVPTIGINESAPISFNIETSRKTPHGTYFSQSAYFLRFSITFSFAGSTTQVVLKSKGYFTDEQWNKMVTVNDSLTSLNYTYMHSLGVDGLIPDSSFGLKQSIPIWPLAVLIAGCLVVAFLVAYYFVLDNPGKFPKLEKRFYYLRGKLSESRRKLKDRGRK